MYEYVGRVKSVYDGDTFRADVDLGFKFWASDYPFRLNGLNTPEMKGGAGKEAKAFLREQMPDGALIRINTIKDKTEKYGRYLAEAHVMRSEGWVSVNGLLLKEGLALAWDGKGERPV